MRRYPTFKDHQSLQEELKLMRISLKKSEREMKENTKKAVLALPYSIFNRKTTSQKIAAHIPLAANPTGKILARVVNKTILKKQGFVTRFIAGFFLRRAGKKIEDQLLKTKNLDVSK